MNGRFICGSFSEWFKVTAFVHAETTLFSEVVSGDDIQRIFGAVLACECAMLFPTKINNLLLNRPSKKVS